MGKNIYRLSTIVLALFLILMTIGACDRSSDARDSKGNPIRLSDYQGKWVIINYWATWCEPCLEEMPALDKLYRHHSNNLVVLGVSQDALSNPELLKTEKKMAIHYPLLSTFPLEKIGIKNISVLPTTFILKPKRKTY